MLTRFSNPTVGDDFLPAAPSQLINESRFCKNISTIFGWNLNEYSLFTSPEIHDNETVVESLLQGFPGLKNATIENILPLYTVSDFEDKFNASAQYYRNERIQGDIGYVCPSILFARQLGKTAPAYLYQLEQTPFQEIWKSIDMQYYGVSHFSDIPYVFDEVAGFNTSTVADVNTGSEMSGSWTRFSATGAPSAASGNGTLRGWLPAFEPIANSHGGNSSCDGVDDLEVFAIGGDEAGSVDISKDTQHQGLQRVLERCSFLESAGVFEQIGT